MNSILCRLRSACTVYFAIIVSCLAADIDNGGFEKGVAAPTGWANQVKKGDAARFIYIKGGTAGDDVHTGTRAVGIEAPGGYSPRWFTTHANLADVVAGNEYQLIYWIRTRNLDGDDNVVGRLEFFDDGGESLGAEWERSSHEGNADWREITFTVTAPKQAVSAKPIIHFRDGDNNTTEENCRVTIDDVSVRPAGTKAQLPTEMDLYLLIGQSNMAGRGTVAQQDRTPHPRVFKLNRQDEWVPAVEPLHFDKPFAGVGPGLSFGKVMARANSNVAIGLIPCATGGSPIRVWKPGAYWEQTDTKPYDEMLRRTRIATRRGHLKGILWHQGEADSGAAGAANYLERLDDLIGRLRHDLGAPSMPVVVGGMSDALMARKPHAGTVNRALATLPRRVENTACVSAEQLTLKEDRVHFDADSARELGHRYARAMLKIQDALRQSNPQASRSTTH